MNEFSHETSRPGARSHARLGHLHHHRHHRSGGCVPEAGRDAGRRGSGERGERIRAAHELRHALATVARTGDEQLRGQAAQILAEATSRLNGLLGADR